MDDQDDDPEVSPNTETTVGSGDYVVGAGECIASIAYDHGHYWQTILNHPDNWELKQARKNYHILLPGDRLTIPPICTKDVSAATDQRHTFVLKGVPEMFRMRLLDEADEPRTNLQYVLIVGSNTYSGTTDDQGELQHSIPPNARQGRLILGVGMDTEEMELNLGDLNPSTETSGAQARLTNLGLDCGPVDGILGPKTRDAIKRFQKARKLGQTGKLDDPTRQELEKRHGS